MSKLIELRQKRTQLIAEAQRVLLDENLDNEKRAKALTMVAEVETMEQDIDTLEKLERFAASDTRSQRPPRPQPDGTIAPEQEAEQAEYRAFEKMVRFGKSELTGEERQALRGKYEGSGMAYRIPGLATKSIAEKRDVTTTSGAALVPQLFLPTLIDAKKAIGGSVTVVRKKVTDNNGAPIKIALSNDTGNSLTTLTAETTVVTEQDPSFSGFIMSTDTVATLVKVSLQELADSYFDLNSWLRDKFGIRYLRGLESMLTAGNGSNVASLVTTAHASNTTAAATGPVYEDFTACYGGLDPAYLPNGKWMMSQLSRVYVMGLLDAFNRPLFLPSPNTGTLDQILGQPIVLNQAMAATSTAAAVGVLLGDFEEGYVLRTDGDLHVMRLDERYADTLEVGFIGYTRIGGAATDAGTHPILKMTTHA